MHVLNHCRGFHKGFANNLITGVLQVKTQARVSFRQVWYLADARIQNRTTFDNENVYKMLKGLTGYKKKKKKK